MPMFTAIALDRLMEKGASESMASTKNLPDSKLEGRSRIPNSKQVRGINAPKPKLDRRISVPIPKVESSNGASSKMKANMKHHLAQPALYATPEPTPVPDSPSSFTPSPYIINHKRRGPRLMKSFSEDDVSACQKDLGEQTMSDNVKEAEQLVIGSSNGASTIHREVIEPFKDENVMFTPNNHFNQGNANGIHDGGHGTCDSRIRLPTQSVPLKSVTFHLEQDVNGFYDPQESSSVKSNSEGESNGGPEHSFNNATPSAEFYDAWEDLSSENGHQPSPHNVETELREIRLSLLIEIEKRKQVEENLINMRSQWVRIREQLSVLGLTLPEDPCVVAEEDEQQDIAENLCSQVYIARLVSSAIGKGTAKAEAETNMEAQIEAKNFEIARLGDRLHHYEALNREMSQRNQEAVETSRRPRPRQTRKLRQRLVWGSIAAAALSLGTAVFAWSYFSSEEVSSFHASDDDHSCA